MPPKMTATSPPARITRSQTRAGTGSVSPGLDRDRVLRSDAGVGRTPGGQPRQNVMASIEEDGEYEDDGDMLDTIEEDEDTTSSRRTRSSAPAPTPAPRSASRSSSTSPLSSPPPSSQLGSSPSFSGSSSSRSISSAYSPTRSSDSSDSSSSDWSSSTETNTTPPPPRRSPVLPGRYPTFTPASFPPFPFTPSTNNDDGLLLPFHRVVIESLVQALSPNTRPPSTPLGYLYLLLFGRLGFFLDYYVPSFLYAALLQLGLEGVKYAIDPAWREFVHGYPLRAVGLAGRDVWDYICLYDIFRAAWYSIAYFGVDADAEHRQYWVWWVDELVRTIVSFRLTGLNCFFASLHAGGCCGALRTGVELAVVLAMVDVGSMMANNVLPVYWCDGDVWDWLVGRVWGGFFSGLERDGYGYRGYGDRGVRNYTIWGCWPGSTVVLVLLAVWVKMMGDSLGGIEVGVLAGLAMVGFWIEEVVKMVSSRGLK